jgi:hypothetical protein
VPAAWAGGEHVAAWPWRGSSDGREKEEGGNTLLCGVERKRCRSPIGPSDVFDPSPCLHGLLINSIPVPARMTGISHSTSQAGREIA